MSDPATADPVVPPPPLSHPERDRAPSMAASPPHGHVAPSPAIARAGRSSCPAPRSPPSLPSSSSNPLPSTSGSRVTATSLPTTVTVSSGSGPAPAHDAGQGTGSTSTTNTSTNHSPPPRNSQLHVAEARAALVASMSNMLDSELQSRAAVLHSNAAVLSRQEQDVAKATEGLRKENDKLAKVVKDAGRKIKELGNVQNWAEVLERDFLVLEETMRLVRNGGAESEDEDGTCSECSGSYWSGSESERDHDGGGERSGTMLGSLTESHKGSVSELDADGSGEGEGEGVNTAKEPKGKGLSGSTLNSGSSTVGDRSTPSNASASPTHSTTVTLSSTANGTVSLDEAILESLAEALTTDMHIKPKAPAQNAA
ncbi:hypothetical protein F4777DRAFT_343365 [Nemania sp. FL0916]|nr:hypothetical protein F4777DRAFT_343365 [Nemania sp. FL0916]